jgi:cytochrome P450
MPEDLLSTEPAGIASDAESGSAAELGADLEFDHWSSKIAYSPWDVWSRMRSQCPVARTETHGGYYVLTRYDDVFAAALNPGLFSSDGDGLGVAVPPQPIRPLYPLELDPPQHTAYRALLNPRLNPRAVAEMEPWVRAIVQEMVAQLPVTGVFDVAERFTLPMPKRVAYHVLGFPEDIREEVSLRIDQVSTNVGDRNGEAGPRLLELLTAAIAARRAGERQDDLLDAVIFGQVGGVPLDDAQVMAMLILLLFGGLGTTSAALACMFLWLGDHPDDRARLHDHPELHDRAVDEFIRWASPVAHLGRTVVTDTEMHCCPMAAGSRVVLAYGSANRDETQFDRPDEVIVDRHPNRHVAFGVGPHRCVGSHLARLQMKVTLQELLAGMLPFRVHDHGQIRWVHGETRLIDRLLLEVGYAK